MTKYEAKIETLKHSIAFIKSQPTNPTLEKIVRVSEKMLAEMTRGRK